MLRIGIWRRLAAIVVCLVACITTGTAESTTFHVSPQGSNTPPYDTYANAAQSVADAVLAASGFGDTVLVHTGVYDFDTTISIPEGVAWAGVGRDSVFLNWIVPGNDPGRIATLSGNNEIWGMEFHNPQGTSSNPRLTGLEGATAGSFTIHDCRFRQLQASFGGSGRLEAYHNEFYFGTQTGIHLLIADSWIHHNRFLGQGMSGEGILCLWGDSVLVEHNTFNTDRDETRDGFSAVFVRDVNMVTIRNNLILNCYHPVDLTYASALIENNTMIRTFDTRYGSIDLFLRPEHRVTIRNNIMQDFLKPPMFANQCETCPPTDTITLIHNAYWPPVDSFYRVWYLDRGPEDIRVLDSANINAYPMFTYDPENGITDSTFPLQLHSPLIDAGDPTVLDVDGSRSDIGWTGGPGGRSYPYLELAPRTPGSLSVDGTDTLLTLSWIPRPEIDLASHRLYRGGFSGFWSGTEQPLAELAVDDSMFDDTIPRTQNDYYYVITAVDFAGLESLPSEEAVYYIDPPNQPPVITSPPIRRVKEGDSLFVFVSATDPEGDHIQLWAEDLPVNASFADNGDDTGWLSFFPVYTQSGRYTVRFVAFDDSLTDVADMLIIVRESGNQRPILNTVAAEQMAEGQILILSITASDPDGDSLVLRAEDLPTNATFFDNGNGTGMLEFRPDFTQQGTYEVRFIVSDGELADTAYTSITVEDMSYLLPRTAKIVRAFPNPSNASVLFDVAIPKMEGVTRIGLTIYDILGRHVADAYDGHLAPGFHTLRWNGNRGTETDIASGIYFARLVVDGASTCPATKLVILK